MRNIPVNTDGLRFIAAGDAEPKIADPSTGEIKTDGQGRTLYQLPLLPIPNDDRGSSILVAVPASEPPTLTEGEPVHVTGLVAFAWSMNGRSGVSYRAESVTSKATAAVGA